MNLFNGLDGTSDGTKDGPSHPITGDGADRNVYVGGEFDGARVVIYRYSTTRNAFFPTEGVWTTSNEFIKMSIKIGDIYRLEIESAGPNTNLFAEVS